MIESEVIVTTKHGRMPTFMAAPDAEGQHPGIIFYMDAPGIREELRNMARRIAKHGYVCLLPDMYYRLGTVRLDIPRRDDGMSGVIRASMNSLSIPFVNDDTAAMLAWFDASDRVKPGAGGCVGHCMSGRGHRSVRRSRIAWPRRHRCTACRSSPIRRTRRTCRWARSKANSTTHSPNTIRACRRT
jgi:hypothetical protein